MRKRTRSTQKIKPIGKTLGEALEENSDLLTITSWLYSSPSVPTENLFNSGYPSTLRPAPELAELVTKWKVSVEETKAVYKSWVEAQRQFRRLYISGKRQLSIEAQTLAELKFDFWDNREHIPVSVRLHDLTKALQAAEAAGIQVSLNWVRQILSEQKYPDSKKFLKWLIKHWIAPDGATPPLCLCSDSVLETMAAQNPSLKGVAIPDGDSLRKAIEKSGLYRPASVRVKKQRSVS